MMESMLRNVLLYLSKHQGATRAARRYGLRFGANRFVAGERVQEAMEAIEQLHALGIVATIDHLGEFVRDAAEARDSADACVAALDAIEQRGVRSHLSVKLTQLGLDLSPAICYDNMCHILDRAALQHNFVRIDMEDYAHNEATLTLFRSLREQYGPVVGVVLQSYLYKTEADLAALAEYAPNIRFVKGAYKEPAEVAYPDKADVDRQLVNLIGQHLLRGHYAAVATHDDAIIEAVKQFVVEHNIPRTQFEFQMLYGIRPQAQAALAQQGYTMRVYVPYGNDWYGYFMRRLAERPANLQFVLRSLFRR